MFKITQDYYETFVKNNYPVDKLIKIVISPDKVSLTFKDLGTTSVNTQGRGPVNFFTNLDNYPILEEVVYNNWGEDLMQDKLAWVDFVASSHNVKPNSEILFTIINEAGSDTYRPSTDHPSNQQELQLPNLNFEEEESTPSSQLDFVEHLPEQVQQVNPQPVPTMPPIPKPMQSTPQMPPIPKPMPQTPTSVNQVLQSAQQTPQQVQQAPQKQGDDTPEYAPKIVKEGPTDEQIREEVESLDPFNEEIMDDFECSEQNGNLGYFEYAENIEDLEEYSYDPDETDPDKLIFIPYEHDMDDEGEDCIVDEDGELHSIKKMQIYANWKSRIDKEVRKRIRERDAKGEEGLSPQERYRLSLDKAFDGTISLAKEPTYFMFWEKFFQTFKASYKLKLENPNNNMYGTYIGYKETANTVTFVAQVDGILTDELVNNTRKYASKFSVFKTLTFDRVYDVKTELGINITGVYGFVFLKDSQFLYRNFKFEDFVNQVGNFQDLADSEHVYGDMSRIVLGATSTGFVEVDLKANLKNHALFAGGTGSGKTTLAHATVMQMLASGQTILICMDTKGALSTLYDEFGFICRGSFESMVDFISGPLERFFEEWKELVKLAGAKHSDFQKKFGIPLPKVVLFIDEYESFYEVAVKKTKKDGAKYKHACDVVANIARQARAYGWHLFISTQTPSATGMQTSVRNQLNYKCIGRECATLLRNMGFNSPDEATKKFINNTGHFMCSANYGRMKAMYLDDTKDYEDPNTVSYNLLKLQEAGKFLNSKNLFDMGMVGWMKSNYGFDLDENDFRNCSYFEGDDEDEDYGGEGSEEGSSKKTKSASSKALPVDADGKWVSNNGQGETVESTTINEGIQAVVEETGTHFEPTKPLPEGVVSRSQIQGVTPNVQTNSPLISATVANVINKPKTLTDIFGKARMNQQNKALDEIPTQLPKEESTRSKELICYQPFPHVPIERVEPLSEILVPPFLNLEWVARKMCQTSLLGGVGRKLRNQKFYRNHIHKKETKTFLASVSNHLGNLSAVTSIDIINNSIHLNEIDFGYNGELEVDTFCLKTLRKFKKLRVINTDNPTVLKKILISLNCKQIDHLFDVFPDLVEVQCLGYSYHNSNYEPPKNYLDDKPQLETDKETITSENKPVAKSERDNGLKYLQDIKSIDLNLLDNEAKLKMISDTVDGICRKKLKQTLPVEISLPQFELDYNSQKELTNYAVILINKFIEDYNDRVKTKTEQTEQTVEDNSDNNLQ